MEHHEAKVPRELLEGNIGPVMKLKLRAKASPTSSINDCLDILDNMFKAKYPAWFRNIFNQFKQMRKVLKTGGPRKHNLKITAT